MMKTKNGLLKWLGLVELIIGALNLANGLMSLFVLVKQGNDILVNMQAELGVAVTMQELTTSVLITVIGGGVMLGAGMIAMMFNGVPGKQNLPLGMGAALLVYLLVSDIIAVVVMKNSISSSMLFPFVFHGLYLFAAFRNKQKLESDGV